MNKIYQKNLDFLKKLNVNMYSKVLNTEVKNCKLIVNHNKKNLIKSYDKNMIHIHSSYDVKRAGRYLNQKISEKDSQIVVIFGCGLGYEVREILKGCFDKTVFIIEPDREIFKLMLQTYDIKTIVNQKNVFFTQDEIAEDIAYLIINFMKENKKNKIDIIPLTVYKVIYNNLLNDVLKIINKFINNVRTEIITNVTFHRQWFYNFIVNLKYLKDAYFIKSLEGLFENLPVIIVGAGPSLKYDLETLKRYSNKAIIVAAGTGIDVLERNNIKAHFAGAISGGIGEENIFTDLKVNKNINMFYSSQVFNSVPSLINGKKFLIGQNVMDLYVLRRLKYSVSSIYSGPSIVNVLVNNLMEMGSKLVVLLGTDFCYSHDETYSEGAKEHFSIDSLKEKENSGNFIRTVNKNGEEVYTIRPFLSMKYEMERQALKFKHCKLYNAARDGLKINNATDISLEEFLKQLPDLNIDKKVEFFVNNISDKPVSEDIDFIIENVNRENERVIGLCKKLIFAIQEDKLEAEKKVDIKKFTELLKSIPFFNEVLKTVIDQIDVLYEDKVFSEKIRLSYLYLLDKCLIIRECFDNYL